MSEWITIKEKLPIDEQECWVCQKENQVIFGIFEENHRKYTLSRNEIITTIEIEDAFRLDDEYCHYLYVSEITHWMPYYTPQPPK